MITRRAFSASLLGTLPFVGCGTSGPETAGGPGTITILGARVIPGAGAAPIDDAAIVVEGSVLRAVGPREAVAIPRGGATFDAAGKTAIPGLVDTHCHYSGNAAEVARLLKAQLQAGVTTARCTGTDTPEILAVFEDVRAGKIPGPRLYSAGLGFTHPKGHPAALTIVRRPATAAEARDFVRQMDPNQTAFVKIWIESKYGTLPKITPGIRTAIVEEANKAGMRVVAHIFDEEDLRQMADLGVTDFLHTVRDRPVSPALLAYAGEKHLSFSPTLTVIDANWHFPEHPEELSTPLVERALPQEALARLNDPAQRAALLAKPEVPKLKEELKRAQAFVKAAADAGVPLAAGSDNGSGSIAIGWGTHREMELMTQAGLAPAAVVEMATTGGARLLSREQPDYGTLAEGKQADLVLLDADPATDILNTRRIHKVMQAGRWI